MVHHSATGIRKLQLIDRVMNIILCRVNNTTAVAKKRAKRDDLNLKLLRLKAEITLNQQLEEQPRKVVAKLHNILYL